MSQTSGNARTECRERLRSAVRERLLRGPSDAPAGQPMTARALEQAWSSDANGHDYAGLALSTLSADEARELLTRMLSHANALSSLEAAAALAVLGSRAGLERLQRVETLTNSQIEFFYARAAFALLDEPAPASLTDRRSVFMELEALVDACQQHARGD